MKELKCPDCGDLFVQDYQKLDKCDACAEVEEQEIDLEEPDMSGADGANSGER